jgi:hypothetical protein
VSRGATEDLVEKLADYERSDLPERTKAALRFADWLSGQHPLADRAFYDALRNHFSDDEILDLGMTITFVSGWQRFIEAFGILPDRWTEASPLPFHSLLEPPAATSSSTGQRATPSVPGGVGNERAEE